MALLIPNSTQVPNFLMDELLPIVDSAGWKIISFICRKTYGWQKREDRISLSQFESGTGVSRPWLVKTLGRLTSSGLLLKTRSQRGDVYGLNLESDAEEVKRILQRPRPGEFSSRVKLVNQSTQLPKTGELSFKTGELTLPTKQTKTKPRNLSGTTSPSRGARIPENFSVTDEHREFSRKNNFPPPEEIIDEFIDYWRAVPGVRGLKLDWDATFRNRLRETATRHRGRGGTNGNGSNSGQADIIRAAAERVARQAS